MNKKEEQFLTQSESRKIYSVGTDKLLYLEKNGIIKRYMNYKSSLMKLPKEEASKLLSSYENIVDTIAKNRRGFYDINYMLDEPIFSDEIKNILTNDRAFDVLHTLNPILKSFYGQHVYDEYTKASTPIREKGNRIVNEKNNLKTQYKTYEDNLKINKVA